jgi:hypothetical protein
MEHFTAWLTTDPSCLDQDYADVVVLADELRGEPNDPNAWASTGDPLFHDVTEVHARDGEYADAERDAKKRLEDAGWKPQGPWESVPTGATVTVVRT